MKQKAHAKPDGPVATGWDFKKGNSGVKQEALKSSGRNMARVQNQKGKK